MFSSMGCGGYWPVRRPRSDLWSAGTRPVVPIQWPMSESSEPSIRLQQEQVSISVDLPDARQTKAIFHADLLSHHIQPLHLTIHNGSERPYLFRKASLDAHYIPAHDAARWACVPPIISGIEHLRWATFVLPGLLFETLIEPVTTFDFPGMEEAASRPLASNRREVVEDFVAHEFPDGPIAPGSAQSGVVLIHPPLLGRSLPLTLTDVTSQQPLVFDLPIPPPVYAAVHTYPQPYDVVWGSTLNAASRIRIWKMVNSDAHQGLVNIRKGISLWIWSRATPITVTLQRIDETHTSVTVHSPLRATTTVGLGVHSPTVDQFFDELDARLLPPKLKVESSDATSAPSLPQAASRADETPHPR